ncbi:MAG: helix-turn-helix transcriptional regulator [Planctomycetes bacterium]|nr:helix-turn-helix transcriptional regulator [Planctomycetota bacterium]
MKRNALATSYVQVDEHTNPGRYCHQHDDTELVYCIDGSGSQLTPYGELAINHGDVFVFARGQEHMSFCKKQEHFSIFVCNLHEEMFDADNPFDREALRALRNIALYATEQSCLLPLQGQSVKQVQQLLNQVNMEFLRRTPGYNALIKSYITELLIVMQRDQLLANHKLPALPNPSNSELIAEVLHYLEVNYMRSVKVDDVLNFCPLSRSHFHAIFRQECGMTFIDALHAVRIRRACELLKSEPDRSMVEVSMCCGFQSQSHFCHTFKKTMDQSPRQYRKVHV